VKNLGELDGYPWSGHKILMGREKSGWQKRNYVLGQFHPREKEAIRSYRRFMEEGKDGDQFPYFQRGFFHGLFKELTI
jgi:hypothetical protein